MINVERVEEILRDRYPDLESVGPGVYRGVDRFGAREYAIRYFDLNDRLATTAESLKRYQEEVLSPMYFSTQVGTDLRWSHYLYFITSDEAAEHGGFGQLKARVEADREYARKQVVREREIVALFTRGNPAAPADAMPKDLSTTWLHALEQHGLGFIIDEDISVPEVVRRIVAGSKDKAVRPVSPLALLPAEKAVVTHFLNQLTIKGFRPQPEQKDHSLGRVNLIVGSNGAGKTSLLESIEFAYCGRNRRPSVLLEPTSITLALSGSGEKLSSTTDPARLRARHSNWYAKAEVKKISIHDSFGKFNFLDTDAAVNLSVSSSSEQIGADVARLVLGAAAENVADRLRRVVEQLREELKEVRRERETNLQLKSAASARVDAIKISPKLSDSLFLDLLSALKHLGWLQPPEEKGGIATLREMLQHAASSTELLRHSSIDVLHSDPQSALQLLSNLNEEAQRASALDKRARSARLEQSRAMRLTQTFSDQVAAIEALLPYARVDYARLAVRVRDGQDSLRARASRLAPVVSDVRTTFAGLPLDQTVHSAHSNVQVSAQDLKKQLSTARATLHDLESTQSSLAVLVQRLRATAQEIMQRVPNPDHCPVCHTEFEGGQLLIRMTSEVGDSTSAQVAQIQVEIGQLDERLVAVLSAQAALETIRTFLGDRARSVTVREALTQIEQERNLLERERTSLVTLQSQIKQLQVDGLSAEDLSERLLVVGLAELPSLDDLLLLQAERKKELSSSQEALRCAKQEVVDIDRECELTCERLSIDISGGAEALAVAVQKQVKDVESALGARQELTYLMSIPAGISVNQISLELSSTQQLLVGLSTAISQERSNDDALDKEANAVAGYSRKIDACDQKINRLMEVDGVLVALREKGSGEELAKQILANNAQEIARTFSRIHMPNEFDVQVDGGALAIVRRSTGSHVELGQMSTGQRAAFALSVFLAMNASLRSGPPVLLFDDPVAHVDDINVLSFLDHLRDLAIGGTRQIFFATADTKLAGLFRHKFRFLGDEFKEIRLSRT